jgi:type III restriction enzyme
LPPLLEVSDLSAEFRTGAGVVHVVDGIPFTVERGETVAIVCDTGWEAEFCRAAEANARVRAYVKNQGLGFEVPYLLGATPKKYLPDFIVRVDDCHGGDDLLNLVVEIKGYRGEDAKDKANTMAAYWVPGVNNPGTFGRWAFAEFKESVYAIAANFDALIERAVAGAAV